jgi:hypothetical protein
VVCCVALKGVIDEKAAINVRRGGADRQRAVACVAPARIAAVVGVDTASVAAWTVGTRFISNVVAGIRAFRRLRRAEGILRTVLDCLAIPVRAIVLAAARAVGLGVCAQP